MSLLSWQDLQHVTFFARGRRNLFWAREMKKTIMRIYLDTRSPTFV